MTFTPHPYGLMGSEVDNSDPTIVWDDTPLLAYWDADGSNDAGAECLIYFYETTKVAGSDASQAGVVSRLDGTETYVDTIDPDGWTFGEYLVKYERVTLVSGAWTNLYMDFTGDDDGTWYDLFRHDLRVRDLSDDGTNQHFIIDVTIATDNGAGAPVAGTEKTKRVEMFAAYGNSRAVYDRFTGTNGTAIDDTSYTPDTDTEGGGWIVDTGTPELYSGHLVGGASGDHRCVIDAGFANAICRAEIMPDTLGGSSQPYGIIFRRQDSSNYWELILEDADTSNPVLKINEINSGTPTNRDSVTMTGIGPLDGGDCHLQIECIGNVLTGFFQAPFACTQDELFDVTWTSTSMNTEQHFGLRLTGDGSGGTGARADEFAVKEPGVPISAFDDLVESLSPAVWYKFDENDNFAGTITDHGSAGVDVTSQNSTDASVGAALRNSTLQSLEMPAFTAGNWSTEGANYQDAANAMNAVTSGTPWTIIWSCTFDSKVAGDNVPMFGVGPSSHNQTNASWLIRAQFTGGLMRAWKEHSTGSTALTGSDDVQDPGQTTYFFVWRMAIPGDTGRQDLWENGVRVDYGFRVSYPISSTDGFNIGGVYNSEDAVEWRTDCLAIWDSALTDQEIEDLWELYNAEAL
jgi:hypothetical protein